MYSSDLTNFVTSSVIITDILGNPVSNYYLDNDYYFKITFKETALMQLEYHTDELTDEDYLTYQFPAQLKVSQETVDNSPFNIFGEAENPLDPKPIIGYYSIATDGSIKVHFDDVDKYGNPALIYDEETSVYVPINFIDYYSDASFTLDILANFAEVGDSQAIDFGNDVIITITVDNPLGATLDIVKTAVPSPIEDKTVTYTITIKALNGKVSNISLNDTEQIGTNGYIRFAKFVSMNVSVDGGTPYTPPEFVALVGQYFGDGFNLDFKTVVLEQNETIIVTFTLDITDLLNSVGGERAGISDEYDFDFWLYNHVTAQGIDEYEEATPEAAANNNVQLYRRMLDKSGAQNLDFDYSVWWTNWHVGDDVTPINDCVVTDILTGMVVSSNNVLSNGQNGVSIIFEGPGSVPIANWLIPVAVGATGFSFTVPSEYELVETGTSLEGITVLALGDFEGKPYGPITKIVLGSYFWTVVADESDFDDADTNFYENTITLQINTDSPSYTAKVQVNRPGASPLISKTGNFVSLDDLIDYIEWKISYYVPKSAYNHPVAFMDDLLIQVFGYDGSSPGDATRLAIENVPIDVVVKVYNENLGERELIRDVDYTLLDKDHSNGYIQAENSIPQWFLYFIGDTSSISWGDLLANSIWPYQDDTWITITYKISLDALVGEGDTAITYKEALNWSKGDAFSNTQNWIYGFNPILDVTYGAVLKWGVRKSGIVSGNTITYTIAINADNFDYSNVLTDVFDPLLEYVPFSMKLWKNGESIIYGPYEMIASTFTDILNENIVGNSFSLDFLNMPQINWGVDGAEYMPSPTLLSDTPHAYESYYIEFKMKLKDDESLGQHKIINTVELNGFTSDRTDYIGNKIADKTISTTSNIASVNIIINPDEKNLAGTAGKFTVTDILSDTLAIYLTTLVVDAWEVDTWITKSLINSTSGDIWTYSPIDTNQINLVVPDSTKLRITYSALIKGSTGDTVAINNEVTVAGEYRDNVSQVFFISDTTGSCSGSRTKVTVIKNDSINPEILLQGAVFALYISVGYTGWESVELPIGINRIITIGTMDFYYLTIGTTNEIGQYIFDNQWLTPTHEEIYALNEIEIPVGYDIPAETTTLFAYNALTEIQKSQLGPISDDMLQISDHITISNTKQKGSPSQANIIISGRKCSIGKKLPKDRFLFGLYDKNNELINITKNGSYNTSDSH